MAVITKTAEAAMILEIVVSSMVLCKAVDYKVYQMWPPFLSLKILGLGRQVNWLYRPACVGRLCHSKYKMAATSDILYKSTALVLLKLT